ncbi:NAD dependent epimerase/dehydratase [Aspergillus venezuelensis]
MATYQFHDIVRTVTRIDRRHGKRQVPMKVLALGLCRTGTDSLRQALRALGYNDTYHGYLATLENPRDCELWYEALQAKYDGVGKPFGREEFDQLLGNCQAVCDFPAAAFAEELIEAYPEAKVILTDRDIDEWHSSVKQTFEPVLSNPLLPLWQLLENVLVMHTRWLRPTWAKIWKHYFNNNFEANGRKAFRTHYDRVKEIVPPESLLVYNVSQGWEPLCKFLGHPVPRQPYPTGNQVSVFQKRFQDALFYNAKEMVEKLGTMLVIYFQMEKSDILP